MYESVRVYSIPMNTGLLIFYSVRFVAKPQTAFIGYIFAELALLHVIRTISVDDMKMIACIFSTTLFTRKIATVIPYGHNQSAVLIMAAAARHIIKLLVG